jgi:hypothetical protein
VPVSASRKLCVSYFPGSVSSTRAQTAGIAYRRFARRRSTAASSSSALADATSASSPRVCHAAIASVKAAMWKSGNMHTERSGTSRNTPWKPRR